MHFFIFLPKIASCSPLLKKNADAGAATGYLYITAATHITFPS